MPRALRGPRLCRAFMQRAHETGDSLQGETTLRLGCRRDQMARVEKFWESSPMTSDRTSTLNIIELYCMCLTRVTSFAKKRTQITEFRRFVHAQVPKSSANRVVGPSRRPVERVLSTVTRLELPTVPSRVLFQRNSAHRAIDGYHPFFFIRSTSGLSSLPNPLSGAPEGFSHCDA